MLWKIPPRSRLIPLPIDPDECVDSSPSWLEFSYDNKFPIPIEPSNPPELDESLFPNKPPPLIALISFKFNSCIFITVDFDFAYSIIGFRRIPFKVSELFYFRFGIINYDLQRIWFYKPQEMPQPKGLSVTYPAQNQLVRIRKKIL